MNKIDALMFQSQALERRYLAEVSRKETVRNSLALPIAVLSFASFGFAALANTASWRNHTMADLLISCTVLLLAVFAGALFVRAVILLSQIALNPIAPEPLVLQFSKNADRLESGLLNAGLDPVIAREEAISAALEEVCTEYSGCSDDLHSQNNRLLESQTDLLKTISIGLGMLILAILISTVSHVVS